MRLDTKQCQKFLFEITVQIPGNNSEKNTKLCADETEAGHIKKEIQEASLA